MRRALLALLLLEAVAASARPPDPLAVIDECLGRLDQGLDVGFERIAERCPALAPTLEKGPWAASLPADWDEPQNELSAQGLSELRALLARELSVPTPPGRAPRAATAAPVLAKIARTEEARSNWWTRLKSWLRELMSPREREQGSWLQRLLAKFQLTHDLAQLLLWGAMALVILLALLIVLNELRVAGALRLRTRGRPPGSDLSAAGEGVTLTELERSGAQRQPALLLELITATLARQNRLPPARAFTAREVVSRAELSSEADRGLLRQLALVCEELRYAERGVAAQSLASAVSAGRSVLAALQAPLQA